MRDPPWVCLLAILHPAEGKAPRALRAKIAHTIYDLDRTKY